MLNVVRVIRDAKDKKTEITEKNCAARAAKKAAKKAADIANQMTWGKLLWINLRLLMTTTKDWRMCNQKSW